MIANPSIPAYRYDPYARVFTRERYDHAGGRGGEMGLGWACVCVQEGGVQEGCAGREG